MAPVRLKHALVLTLALACAPGVASAQSSDRVSFGGDVVVGAGETVSSVASFGGDAIVDGRVEGDVVSFGGDVELGPSAQVTGSVSSLGGRVEAAQGARFHPGEDITPYVAHAHRSGLGAWLEETFRQLVAHGLLFLLGLLLMGLAPDRLGALQVAIVRDPVRRHAAGVTVLFVASLVPLLGTLVVLVASCLGLGALVRTKFRTTLPTDLADRADVIACGPYRTV